MSEIVTDTEQAKTLWESHLQSKYTGLPSSNKYEAVVESVEREELSNIEEEITIIRDVMIEEEQFVLVDTPDSEITVEGEIQSITVEDCSVCHGSGDYCSECNDTGSVSCPSNNCNNGVTEVECQQCDLTNRVETECRVCGGTGYSVEKQCIKCEGRGEYESDGRLVRCDVCDNGVYKEMCQNCGIDGSVMEDCPKCGGQGVIKKGSCEVCSKHNTSSGTVPCETCNNGEESIQCENCAGAGEMKKVESVKIVEESEKINKKNDVDLYNFTYNPPSRDEPLIDEDSLERTVRVSESYNSIDELVEARQDMELAQMGIQSDIEDVSQSNIKEVQYSIKETEPITTYEYVHTDKVTEKIDSVYDSLCVTDPVLVVRNGEFVGFEMKNTDDTQWAVVSTLKKATVNMASDSKYPSLNKTEMLLGLVPGMVYKFYTNPASQLIALVITTALVALLYNLTFISNSIFVLIGIFVFIFTFVTHYTKLKTVFIE